jgi:hypothetical protein
MTCPAHFDHLFAFFTHQCYIRNYGHSIHKPQQQGQ